MITHDYKCRFCGKPGTIKADGGQDEQLLKALTTQKLGFSCDRCGAYMNEKHAITELLVSLCRELQTRPKMKRIGVIRRRVEDLTKRLSLIASKYQHVPADLWSQDFPDKLLLEPGHCARILNEHLRQIEAEARKPSPLGI